MAIPHDKTVSRWGAMAIPTGAYRDELLGSVLLDRYDVFEINQGGFGLVLGVRDRKTGEDVALKTPRPENRHRSVPLDEFKAEVAFWLKLDPHPNIITARSVELVFECPALFMDYVAGSPHKTVRDWLASGPLNLGAAIGLMHQIAIAMTFANRKGEIAHLDLKPENLLVNREGILKVTDFGLARRVQVTAGSYARTDSATWAYAAPEIFRGEVGDQRSDIFSYGLIFYELLAGRLPFPFELGANGADQYAQLRAYHEKGGIKQVTSDVYYGGVPGHSGRELGVILSSCLQHDQGERRDFSDVLDILQRLFSLRTPSYLNGALPEPDPLKRAAGLRELGRYSEALAILNHLLVREPDHADSWQEAAHLMRLTGDQFTAAQFETRAQELRRKTRIYE